MGMMDRGRKATNMTPEETERMQEICKRIQAEKDPATFTKLCDELNSLLLVKEKRLTASRRPAQPTAPPTPRAEND